MITSISDFDQYSVDDAINLQGNVTWVEEKQGQKGSYYKITLELDGGKTYFLCNEKLRKGEVTIKNAILSEYNGKAQVKCSKSTKFLQGGQDSSQPSKGYQSTPQRNASPTQASTPQYRHVSDMMDAWLRCFQQVQKGLGDKVDLNEPAIMAHAMAVGTSLFIEGNRCGLLQRAIESDRSAATNQTSSRGPDMRDVDDDDLPY